VWTDPALGNGMVFTCVEVSEKCRESGDWGVGQYLLASECGVP
jgi:hypothetical protein